MILRARVRAVLQTYEDWEPEAMEERRRVWRSAGTLRRHWSLGFGTTAILDFVFESQYDRQRLADQTPIHTLLRLGDASALVIALYVPSMH